MNLRVAAAALAATTFLACGDMSRGDVSQSELEQSVRQVDRELTDAIEGNDTRVMARLLADDLILTASGGAIVSKARWIEIVETGERTYKSYDTDEIEVRVFGDAAVVTGRADVTEVAEGREYPGLYRFTRVYARHREGWLAVAIQITSLPDS